MAAIAYNPAERARMTRRFIGLTTAVALATLSAVAPAGAGAPEHPAALVFDIERNGATIGRHTVRFTPEDAADGPRLRVDTEIRILVTFASIPVLRYEHDSHAVWASDALVALDPRTTDDGEALHPPARRDRA